MKVIATRHAITRYLHRCRKIPRPKIKTILKNIVKRSEILPYPNIDNGVMYCRSILDDIVLILTNDDDGNIIIKTVMTTEQFKEQCDKIKKLIDLNSNGSNIDLHIAVGNYDNDLDICTSVKII